MGWANERAEPQAPVGFCKNSYSVRTSDGHFFHRSEGRKYAVPVRPGDVIGCLIKLTSDVETGALCLTAVDETHGLSAAQPNPKPGTKLELLRGSSISFSINGKDLGVAVTDISKGMYYPAVSLFRSGEVEASFHDFQYTPAHPQVPAQLRVPPGRGHV